MNKFQEFAAGWAKRCFGLDIYNNVEERCFRFTEEAMELVQSVGMLRHDAHRLVDYVYDRPKGEPYQEIGQVMVTLGILGHRLGLDMETEGFKELARILQPDVFDKIQIKQRSKPVGNGVTYKGYQPSPITTIQLPPSGGSSVTLAPPPAPPDDYVSGGLVIDGRTGMPK